MGNLLSTGPPESEVERLRRLGDHHCLERNRCLEASQAAYHAGNHADAKRFSAAGKEHDRTAKSHHARAAGMAFEANNRSRDRLEVDLHGLRVQEALAKCKECIEWARREKQRSIVFIVGKGIHSADGVSRLRPAVQRLVEEFNLRCVPSQPTPGCITVQLVRPEERGWFENLVYGMCVIC
jgi:U3 small nucleolar RNA-associated protein 10